MALSLVLAVGEGRVTALDARVGLGAVVDGLLGSAHATLEVGGIEDGCGLLDGGVPGDVGQLDVALPVDALGRGAALDVDDDELEQGVLEVEGELMGLVDGELVGAEVLVVLEEEGEDIVAGGGHRHGEFVSMFDIRRMAARSLISLGDEGMVYEP